MVNVTIDGAAVSVEKGTTILKAARTAGITIPTLCYLEGINEIGACRVCVVEVSGVDRLVTACNTGVSEGMEIRTNSPKVRRARRTNVELILSEHDCHCATCVRSGNCALQSLAGDLGILEIPFAKRVPQNRWNRQFPLIRDESKCIKCMRCVQVCDKIQSLGVWDAVTTGSRTSVGVSGCRLMEEADCALCGQCITHCPVGALRERDDTDRVFDALADEEKITVVQIAPAVRAAWGETLGLDREHATVHRLVAALRKMGFDYIFDTDFSADLTIMEEGSEFLERLAHKEEYQWPMFTSCCPGWVRFLKSQYPDMVPQLSTAKSPQQMFGAVAKSYYADLLGVEPERIFSVSVMPCTAKKAECALDTMRDACGQPDVDVVLTTREVDRMIRAEHIDAKALEEEKFDAPLGVGSGAGVIFGATGGVMEAALRTAAEWISGEAGGPVDFNEVRGMDDVKEATYTIGGTEIKVAITSGLKNAGKLLEQVRNGEKNYHFIEVMACPGGCINGGGQPLQPAQVRNFTDIKGKRAAALYRNDAAKTLRKSHESPAVKAVYAEYFTEPGSHLAHKILHTSYVKRDRF